MSIDRHVYNILSSTLTIFANTCAYAQKEEADIACKAADIACKACKAYTDTHNA